MNAEKRGAQWQSMEAPADQQGKVLVAPSEEPVILPPPAKRADAVRERLEAAQREIDVLRSEGDDNAAFETMASMRADRASYDDFLAEKAFPTALEGMVSHLRNVKKLGLERYKKEAAEFSEVLLKKFPRKRAYIAAALEKLANE